ncbi:hypothetical protein [Bartonella sp. CB60]
MFKGRVAIGGGRKNKKKPAALTHLEFNLNRLESTRSGSKEKENV